MSRCTCDGRARRSPYPDDHEPGCVMREGQGSLLSGVNYGVQADAAVELMRDLLSAEPVEADVRAPAPTEVRMDPPLPGIESVVLTATVTALTADGREIAVRVPAKPVRADALTFRIDPTDMRERVLPALTAGAGRHAGDVLVEPLREEALRQVRGRQVTWAQLAERCGWQRPSGKGRGDGERVKRALGLGGDRTMPKVTVRYETAVRLADALGVEPVEVGF